MSETENNPPAGVIEEPVSPKEPLKNAGSSGMISPDPPQSGTPSNFDSTSKYNMTGNPSVYAKMLMTGMSSLGVDGAQTHMMQAKNNLKMMAHQ